MISGVGRSISLLFMSLDSINGVCLKTHLLPVLSLYTGWNIVSWSSQSNVNVMSFPVEPRSVGQDFSTHTHTRAHAHAHAHTHTSLQLSTSSQSSNYSCRVVLPVCSYGRLTTVYWALETAHLKDKASSSMHSVLQTNGTFFY